MTKPSYEVIKRYRDKALKRVTIDLRADLAERWEQKLKADGIGKAEFLRNSIQAYLGETNQNEE